MYKFSHIPNTVGMKKETDPKKFTAAEIQLLEQLREHPEMMVRFQSILAITRNAEGPLPTADAVEALLIEEMRRLGHLTLSQWAIQAEARVGTELQRLDPTVRSRKKKR
jgi:small-conductance mechanosensitive channel